MIGKFIWEERAQASVEYIILSGGLIAAAVIIFTIYSSMVSSAAVSLNESVNAKVGEMNSTIASY